MDEQKLSMETEFDLLVLNGDLYRYALDALEACEMLQYLAQQVAGFTGSDSTIEKAKNYISEYAAEAINTLGEPDNWPIEDLVVHILQKGASNATDKNDNNAR